MNIFAIYIFNSFFARLRGGAKKQMPEAGLTCDDQCVTLCSQQNKAISSLPDPFDT